MTFIDRSFANGDREIRAITPLGTALWLHLRHDRQRATFRVLEERHPFFRAVGMTMNHVRRMGKLDATLAQRAVCLADIRHAEVKYRVGGRRRVALYQHKTRASAVEERHIAECVQMLQAEKFAIPTLRAFDIAH